MMSAPQLESRGFTSISQAQDGWVLYRTAKSANPGSCVMLIIRALDQAQLTSD
jgi:hypothetical protein